MRAWRSTSTKPAWPVTVLLASLVKTFPREFRITFGRGMLDTAHADYLQARRRGWLTALVLVISTAWDFVTTGLKERLRPAWRPTTTHANKKRELGTMLDQLTKDLFYAGRGLIRAPGFTIVTVLTLALGIGANVAIFSVVDAVLLNPLPYPDSDRLVAIRASAPGSDFPEEFGLSAEFFVQYSEHADLLEDLGLVDDFGATFRTDEFAERLRMAVGTASFFSTLGVTPLIGRLPTADDTDDVALIGHWLWVSRFGADSSILGRSMHIAGEMRTVIGVMGPDFQFPEEETAAWIPIVLTSDITPGRFFWDDLIGRVRPGVTTEALAAQLAPLAARLPERFGGSANYARLMEQHRPVVRSLRERIVGDIAAPLWVLLGTVGVVLFIACANVANLFTVRSESRQQYLAIRQALGASRGRLVQAQMAEAVLLAIAGGVAGALIAWVGVPVLLRAAPPGVPRLETVSIDGTGLLFTAAVALVTALLFGLVPALKSSSVNLTNSLRSAGRGSAGHGPRHLGRDALVVLQTALALVLLVGSGLLVRSFAELRNVDPGYDTEDIFSFQVAPTMDGDGPAMARFHFDLMERIGALPGVQSVGVVHELPLDEGTSRTTFVTDDARDLDVRPTLNFTTTGGAYFETMGIQLLRGRLFTRADHETELGNAIVSQSAAELLWPGEDPIGKRLRFSTDTTGWETVVGVVEDIHQTDFRESDPELIYLPLVGRTPNSWAVHSPGYVVKTPRAETITPDIRDLIRQIDPGAPFYAVHTMESLAAESMMRLSFTMLTLGIAAALGLILGAVGLYGVLSYVVTQRTREIGLRMALGSTHQEVRWMVVWQGGRLAGVGVVIGIVAAIGVSRVLDSLLFGIQSTDVTTFLGMSGVMVAVALISSYVPARRASSVDPVRSLSAE